MLRISYSTLLLWSQGRHQEAVDCFLHKETKKTLAMSEGIKLHETWGATIRLSRLVTVGNTLLLFKNPRVEHKVQCPYNDHYELSGIFDCLDGDTLYEFKSGTIGSHEYASGYQLPFYFLLCHLLAVDVQKGILVHYNQHEDTADIMVMYNNPRQIERAKNWIDSLAPEFEEYIVKNGIDKMKK